MTQTELKKTIKHSVEDEFKDRSFDLTDQNIILDKHKVINLVLETITDTNKAKDSQVLRVKNALSGYYSKNKK